jgi:hypothetical protein
MQVWPSLMATGCSARALGRWARCPWRRSCGSCGRWRSHWPSADPRPSGHAQLVGLVFLRSVEGADRLVIDVLHGADLGPEIGGGLIGNVAVGALWRGSPSRSGSGRCPDTRRAGSAWSGRRRRTRWSWSCAALVTDPSAATPSRAPSSSSQNQVFLNNFPSMTAFSFESGITNIVVVHGEVVD